MLADKNQKTSVDGMNQLFTLKRDETNDKSFHVDGDMKNDLGQNKLLTKVNVSRAVKLIYEGKDKSEEDKSVEEKEFSSRLREYANYYEDDTRYPVVVGSKCKKCEFKNDKEPSLKSGYEQCWKTYDPHFNIKSHHIFDLWRFNKKSRRSNFTWYL